MRFLVALLFTGSGVTAIVADAQRWWPACTGSFDALECVRVQDDSYNALLPETAWLSEAATTHLVAASDALMALAVLGLFRLVVPTRWAWGAGAVLAVPFGLLALGALTTDAAGYVSSPALFVARLAVALLWPAALVAAIVIGRQGTLAPPTPRLWVAALVVLVAASPIPSYFPLALVYQSHDTNPWTTGYAGVLTVLAAGLVLVGRRRPSGGGAQPPASRSPSAAAATPSTSIPRA